jgi:hypothetical protein
LARNSPDGTPNCGQDATRPRLAVVRAHSVVPIVLAITARRNCARCSCVESPSVALPEVVIAISFPTVLAVRFQTRL